MIHGITIHGTTIVGIIPLGITIHGTTITMDGILTIIMLIGTHIGIMIHGTEIELLLQGRLYVLSIDIFPIDV